MFAGALAVAAGLAGAATQRTFVASNGVDTAACSLPAPCRTFTAAIANTLPGGEVIVLDSAGYGAATITQSVSIIAPAGIYAGISVFTGDGITIATPGVNVVLRGLSITGLGGQNGIAFLQGASLVVDRCQVSSMADNGIAIFAPGSRTSISDSEITAAANTGVYADAVLGAVEVTVERTRFARSQWGLYVRQGARATVRDSTFAGHTQYAALAANDFGAGPASKLAVDTSSFLGNVRSVFAVGTTAATSALVSRSVLDDSPIGDYTLAAKGMARLSLRDNALQRSATILADGGLLELAGGNFGVLTGWGQVNPGVLKTFGGNMLNGGGPLDLITVVAPN
jgi:hypothetical protein